MTEMQSEAEFSRLVKPDDIGSTETLLEIDADVHERKALAVRFGLESIEALRGRLRLWRDDAADLVKVVGKLEAEVVQSCVVTLDPVRSRVAESIEWQYSLSAEGSEADEGVLSTANQGGAEVWVEIESADPPELVGPEGIDLGEALAQQLSVALDPFPRAAGAAVQRLDWSEDDLSESSSSPFAVLGELRRNK